MQPTESKSTANCKKTDNAVVATATADAKQAIKLTSTDNEYYQMVPVPPGLLQYYVKRDTIIGMMTGSNIDSLKRTNITYKKNFELECHTRENLLRLIPNTDIGNANRNTWRILVLIKSDDGTNICLKGGLINNTNGEIAFITSINTAIQAEYKHRTIRSHDDEYKICQCKMIAPLLFWEELGNRLTY